MRKLISFYTILTGIILLYSCSQNNQIKTKSASIINFNKIEKQLLFGFDLDQYEPFYDTIKSGWTWSNLFSFFDVSQYVINTTVERLKESPIELKYIVAGKPFVVLKDKKDETPTHLIYEPDPFSYISFEFMGDSVNIKKEKKPVEIKEKIVRGVIQKNSNLSLELNKSFDTYQMTANIAEAIENVYAWSVDFFKLQIGDKFVVVYDEKNIDDKPYAVDKIKYAWFEHSGADLYSFYYQDTVADIAGYYNELAEEMKRPFLMAPVKYTRISSTYSLNRYHPVQKRNKPHLGTDYAAPAGTPIQTTADGTITAASRTSGNGLYVKVRHNSTYETQYLHMSKIENGIKPGVRVKQGDVIGYVGQTGLATGPHVCYRFWKNGKQIDPRSEKFQNTTPMKEEIKPIYLKYITPLKENLDFNITDLINNIYREYEVPNV